MAEGQSNPAQPNAQGAGDAGANSSKLYAGKFRSPEELEAGYQELERGFHGTRQELSETRQEIAEIKEMLSGGRREYGVEDNYGQPYHPYGQNPDPRENPTQMLTEFYRDPSGTFRKVKDEAKRELKEELTREQRKVEDHRGRVSAWLADNQDVASYGDLMSFYVGQTDARLAPEKRLAQAAEKVRARVRELGGTPQSRGPQPGDHVEGPGGGGHTPQGGGNPPQQFTYDPEEELKKHVAAHNSSRHPKRRGS